MHNNLNVTKMFLKSIVANDKPMLASDAFSILKVLFCFVFLYFNEGGE